MSDILEILQANNIEYIVKSNKPEEIYFTCFSGLHEDKNPSLSYNLEKGLFNCFACDYKGNTFKLLQDLGIKTTVSATSQQTFKINKLKDKLNKLRPLPEVTMPELTWPIKTSFKGVSLDTLNDFNAFYTDYTYLQDYLCVPVYQRNKLKFIEGRHLDLSGSSSAPKYIRRPEGVDISQILFPLDKIKDYTTVVLVEGLFDMMNLHDLGFTNSLCFFGTQNFDMPKVRLLAELGVEHAVLMLDGDKPGRAAAGKIKRLIESKNITVTDIILEPHQDPGGLTGSEAEEYLGQFFVDR